MLPHYDTNNILDLPRHSYEFCNLTTDCWEITVANYAVPKRIKQFFLRGGGGFSINFFRAGGLQFEFLIFVRESVVF